MSKEKNNDFSDTVTKLTLAARILALLEKLLPAFLVAWNNHLQQKLKRAEYLVKKSETEQKILAARHSIEIKNHGIKDEEIIDNFLKRKSRPTTTDDPSK